MKTMTCRQMGGPCDQPISGSTVLEMLDSGVKHINELAPTDPAHKQVLVMMDETMKDPAAGQKWNQEFTAKFNALPQE